MVGWWLALGAGAGGLAGLLVGGVGGRALMLVLRTQSPEARGVVSDDGFEIGRVSFDSLNLLAFGASAGALFGVLYVALRTAVPPRLRIALATLIAGAAGGAAFIRPDGADLRILEPTWLALAGFVLLPALCAAITATLVERWSGIAAWSPPRRRMLAFAPAALAAPALPMILIGGGAALVARRVPAPRGVGRFLRIAVPVLLLTLLVHQASVLVREVHRVL